jgi:hypothetical protein
MCIHPAVPRGRAGVEDGRSWRVGETLLLAVGCVFSASTLTGAADPPALTLDWEREILFVRGPHLPGGEVRIWYLEAFCRPGSQDRDWNETVIPHSSRLVERAGDGRTLRLEQKLDDGVIVEHTITAREDEVDFQVFARNPTGAASEAHWAQPCIRVSPFAGVEERLNSEAYLPRCFVFLDGEKPSRMPTDPWSRMARYTPGQVWRAPGVAAGDVNPRPLNARIPALGLIGCYSQDEQWILATAWEPYQELFQGVIVCIHADFRIGGLKPGESKKIRGKLYLVPADMPGLIARYRRDFPEHQKP